MIQNILNFNFSEKGLGLVYPPHFVYDFSRKIFLKLYSINWLNFIVWLTVLLDIVKYVYYSCLLTRLWRHKIWEQFYLSKSFWGETKKHFSSFLNGFKLPKTRIVSDCLKLSRIWEFGFKQWKYCWYFNVLIFFIFFFLVLTFCVSFSLLKNKGWEGAY